MLNKCLLSQFFRCAYLNGRGIDFELAKDCKSFFEQFAADRNVGNVRGVVVIQAIDVFHHTRSVGFDGSQDKQILKVPAAINTELSTED